MADNLIYLGEPLSGFILSASLGYYSSFGNPDFSLTPGETYLVYWDDIETPYTVTAYDATIPNLGDFVVIGDGSQLGYQGNNEPFAIAVNSEQAYFFAFEDSSESHYVYIFKDDTESGGDSGGADEPETTPDEEPEEGIVLKDRNGNDVAYYGIETVTFDTTTEGKQQTYTKGVAVEGLEIVPDFSGGDMAINAPDGTLVKSATIKKPDTLTPENVRNGREIGGVAGTFIGDTEAVEVDLSMADGDQVVSPTTDGKVLSGVTIKKPETLIPENIAEGVDIAGITGTLAAGGGSKVPVFSTVKTFNLGPFTAGNDTLLVSAAELAECGIDLTQFEKWYEDGDEYVPYIEILLLTPPGGDITTDARTVLYGWVSNVGHKNNSIYHYIGAWQYSNSGNATSGANTIMAPMESTNPLEKQFPGTANNRQLLYVGDGNVYITCYYSTGSTKYALIGDYLITVMLRPTS